MNKNKINIEITADGWKTDATISASSRKTTCRKWKPSASCIISKNGDAADAARCRIPLFSVRR